MLQYLRVLFLQIFNASIFLIGIYSYGYLLSGFFLKIKIHKYFDIETIAFMVIFLGMILSLLSIKACRWYFKRLQEQKDN